MRDYRFPRLTAVFMLAVLTLMSAPLVVWGATLHGVEISGAVFAGSMLLLKPAPKLNHDQRRALGSHFGFQMGKIGEGRFVNLDADETAFFERQLELVKARTYDIKYAELKAIGLIPVSTEAGPGADSITYYTYDQTGIAKIISSYADDLPRSDITGKRNTSTVHSIGNAYGYNLQEIRAASMAGLPLTQRKANAARRANDQQVNTIAFFGNAAAGLLGLLNNPNVSRSLLPADGTGTLTTFASKTPTQIVRDLNSTVNAVFTLTLGVETIDTLLMPLGQYTYISSTPWNEQNASNVTILEMFMRNSPFMKAGGTVEWVNECAGAGTLSGGGKDIMMAYRKDPDHLTLEIPQTFEQLPPQERNLEYVIPCHSRIGGVIIYYPLSVNVAEGL